MATADLVVVGGGMAGVCAAIEARSLGLDVLIIERASGLGGTSALSGGHFYLGGGTPVQEACGFHDTPEEMYRYLVAVSAAPDPAKLDAFARDSVAHFHWLESQGICFDRSYYPLKTPMQPGRECLIWSGNEQVWPFCEQAKPAPRGHKIAFDGYDGGGALAMRILIAKATQLGVRTLCDARVSTLLRTDSGRISGVAATHFGASINIAAGHGVILSTGGHVFDAELMRQFSPDRLPPAVSPMGSPYNTGDGLLLGQSVGGTGVNLPSIFITSPFYPPEGLLKGIIVNADGRRFVTEDSYHARTAEHIFRQPDGKAYLILDRETFTYPEAAKAFNHVLIDGWESVAEMAAGLGVPRRNLEETLRRYNEGAAEGRDPEFHKAKHWLVALDQAPYAAFDLSVGKAHYMGFSLGGLRTSLNAEVLDSSGAAIPGLWAAGACASNVSQTCVGYASGTQLAEGSYFGRRAGRCAAMRGR